MVTRAGRRVKPILLVDEAETHLHYDAQADLVTVFTRQDAAAQVIYTTHSAGCLPEDLGTGVRILEPVPGTNHSRVADKFWKEDPGFFPLLLGMGATTLAFFPTRSALITEGASELIVLGTLLREATGLEALGYQITPGASNVKPAHVAGFDLQAPKAVWLGDGDKGGEDLMKKVTAAGIDEDRVVLLGGAGSGLVIEDIVAPQVYVDAVNEVLGRLGEAGGLAVTDLDETNGPGSVAAWCKREGVDIPSKVAVAHQVVEQRTTERLVDPDRVGVLRQLHEEVSAALD
jgi:predicted ATP-dependent endonuclease of OLD family